MKFNEFKPQLTEEQIVLSYCKGEITKEDAVSHLSEMRANLNEFDLRDFANRFSYGAIDNRAEQDAQDKAVAAVIKRGGGKAAQRIAGDAAIKKVSGNTVPGFGNTGDFNQYYDATLDPANKKPLTPGMDGPGPAELKTAPTDRMALPKTSGLPKINIPYITKRPDAKIPEKPMVEPKKEPESFGAAFKRNRKKHGGPGGMFTWNGKQYQTNVKGEKYVKNPTPVGQSIATKANAVVTPKAKPAAGQGAAERFLKSRTPAPTPGQGAMNVAKKKLSGPERLSRLADIPAVSRALGARGELSKDDGEFADPNAMTRGKPKVAPKKKPRTLGKQNSKMPKSFGGFGPRIDDPKGGETVNLPFGGSYKTLPQEPDDGIN
jgi:hypothetical protein